MPRHFREITSADVERPFFKAFGRDWLTSNFIGRVLPGDVGKRVYQVGDILQVENDEQRAARVAGEQCAAYVAALRRMLTIARSIDTPGMMDVRDFLRAKLEEVSKTA